MSSSIIKGFLCSQDGTYTFPLAPKITTIGRENCDITLNNSNIDNQHAVIEFIEQENCYVLQDLNSSNGTYVNDCRVQNAAVRLALQDTIRFGYNSIQFNLVIQEESNVPSIPPIGLASLNRPQAQPLKLINQTVQSRGSNHLITQNTQNSIWTNSQPNATLSVNQRPCGPATIRSRNSSAPLKKPDNNISPKINCWVKGNGGEAYDLELQNRQQHHHQVQSDVDLHSKIFQLEKEMKLKNIEIKELTDKLNSIQISHSSSIIPSASNEIEQLKRDKSVANGLVSTMQKDLSNKEATISKFAREIEALKKEIRDKNTLNQELTEKLGCMKDFKKAEEERQNKEKEVLVLKNVILTHKFSKYLFQETFFLQKFKTTEQRVVELNNQVLQIKGELEDSQKQVFRNIQNEKALKDELEHVKIQYQDTQRAERAVKIELEQSKRLVNVPIKLITNF